jgi:5-methylcytosine-specific restriction endonuclease McrA
MAKRNKTRKRISTVDRKLVLKRDHYICGYCGLRKKPNSLAVDHIIPVAYGGHHGVENFVTACRSCNRRKWHFGPREKGAPRLIMYSGRKVAKLTWLAKGKRFPKRIAKISYFN